MGLFIRAGCFNLLKHGPRKNCAEIARELSGKAGLGIKPKPLQASS
jgi:hypothetical protein